jgi:hypothetical protein
MTKSLFLVEVKKDDIPVSEIQTTGRNVLIGLNMSDIINKYKIPREAPLPTHRKVPWPTPDTNIDLATYEKKYPNRYLIKELEQKMKTMSDM